MKYKFIEKSSGKYRDFMHTHLLPSPSTLTTSSSSRDAHQSVDIFVTDEPGLTGHNHPTVVALGFSLDVVPSIGFNRLVMACIHH